MDDDVVDYMGWSISVQEHLDIFRNEIRELKRLISRYKALCKAMWVRIKYEYPNGGFPDMGLIEGELIGLGIWISDNDIKAHEPKDRSNNFWTADGTWHIKLSKVPNTITVRSLDGKFIHYIKKDEHE